MRCLWLEKRVVPTTCCQKKEQKHVVQETKTKDYIYEADNYFHIKIFNSGQNISKKSKKFIKVRED